MKEVFRVMAKRIEGWPVAAACRDALVERLADHRAVFDGFICAADACEHRLKPHPDLYSLSLFQMGIPPGDYPHCVGLEDTEPGIIALRAAGIGCAVALPNHDTANQDYQAAATVIAGGLPELLLAHNLLLADDGRRA
jgi:beta-phosphoglucomutase-like phosphatase (HAD superfamily)